ncbi:hypothetical protein CPT_Muldoon_206 [Serratia phage Muldoon]|uniref:Uncharacterized protein n=1 Tax=Serratia phage Muldoon TaxID=2601678 RepID=A0A5P8PHG8_9CAUD|nr:hypothetical protein HYP94_gp184 [Serratia phage Muldoon]QFR56157.1 hypothetical protein CPT_Muldoon_206 [Serratia phage Muldoon]
MNQSDIVQECVQHVTTYEDCHELDTASIVQLCNKYKVSVTGTIFDVLELIDGEFKQLPDTVKMSMVSFAFLNANDIDRHTIKEIVRTLCAK